MKNYIIFAVAGIAIAGAGFYGGIKYDRPKSTAGIGLARGNFQDLSPEERQARIMAGGGRMGGSREGGSAVVGEIISKDDKSITVKLQDGGSKIVFLSEKTPVAKSVDGTASDLKTGERVVIMGTANQDGSMTAQSVQVRPAMPAQQR